MCVRGNQLVYLSSVTLLHFKGIFMIHIFSPKNKCFKKHLQNCKYTVQNYVIKLYYLQMKDDFAKENRKVIFKINLFICWQCLVLILFPWPCFDPPIVPLFSGFFSCFSAFINSNCYVSK